MKRETCFGVIPIKGSQVLILLHAKGNYWGFPKGHQEPGENPYLTAKRELFEETGLCVATLLESEMITESYSFVRNGEHIQKEVGYFLAQVSGGLCLQHGEILVAKWVSIDHLASSMTFAENKAVALRAQTLFHKTPSISTLI